VALGAASAAFSTLNLYGQGIVLILIGALVVVVVLLIQHRFGIRQVKRLALRIPSKGLSRYASAVYWVVMSAIILSLAQIAIQVLLMRTLINTPPPQPGGSAPFQGMTLAFTVVLGFISIGNFFVTIAAYAMYISLFSRLWSQLSKTVKQLVVTQVESQDRNTHHP